MTDIDTTYSPEALGVVIRRHRTQQGLSQEELGRNAGYQAGAGVAISRIESGQTTVGSKRLAQLAAALDVPVDQLIHEARAVPPADTGSDAGPAQPGQAKEGRAGSDRGSLRERKARVEVRVKERQEAKERLEPSVEENRARAEAGFVLPFIEIAHQISGAELPDEPTPGGSTTDWQTSDGIQLARSDVSELLRLAVPIVKMGGPLGQKAQMATLRTMMKYGTASTGKAIRALHGAPAVNAAKAALGLGSRMSGGFGIRGGELVLTAIRVSPTILLAIGSGAAVYQVTKLQAVAAAENELDSSQDRFDALVRLLEKSSEVLGELAVYATRAFEKWVKTLPEQRPIAWAELSQGQQQSYRDFVTLVACYLSVAALNLESIGDEDIALSDVTADFDAVLEDAARTVADLL